MQIYAHPNTHENAYKDRFQHTHMFQRNVNTDPFKQKHTQELVHRKTYTQKLVHKHTQTCSHTNTHTKRKHVHRQTQIQSYTNKEYKITFLITWILIK